MLNVFLVFVNYFELLRDTFVVNLLGAIRWLVSGYLTIIRTNAEVIRYTSLGNSPNH